MRNNLNLCLVDDDDIFQFTIQINLKSLNATNNIIAFKNGAEAFDFILSNIENENNLPDIIFLDIDMPVMDGFRFIEEYIKIKPQIEKNIVIYMVSSSVDPVDIERVKKISEISDYIIKPINKQLLKIILQEN
ncbi:response regulator [Aurantibacter crassamenti]|uniref:response regulator n=1 Tax=Aurantibacter crassamenti TaxID=1837375 RepID=UPI001939DFA4|nr:response regulator [Aurantibacter crassamenti]MBM1106078.1 response regulator [Aurantibacter crassamenti]